MRTLSIPLRSLALVISAQARGKLQEAATRPPGSPPRWSCSCCSLPCSRPVWPGPKT